VVYAAKGKSEAHIFSKTGCQPQWNEGADLSFVKWRQDLRGRLR